MVYDFSKKSIVVTGAGAGIGKAVTQKLVACGAKVIAVSLLQAELDDLVRELPSVRAIQTDLRNWDTTRKALSNLGRVHGLVNNAGVASIAPFLETTQGQCDLIFDINVKGLINVSQIVAKSMIENDVKGAIVNLSSVAALVALRNSIVYCASKSAVQAVTRVMALELGKKGIRVNSVNPTVVKTDLSKFVWEHDLMSAFVKGRTPLGRFAEPEEVANAVAFLLSDQASMINGIPLPVDGGFLV